MAENSQSTSCKSSTERTEMRVSTDASDVSTEICRVAVRIPPFWPDEPEIWFAQVEGQFAIANITTDTTKFHYVIGQLEPQYAKEVKDIIVKPPASDKYQKLKSELIKRLSSSNEKKVNQLLLHEELGDRKPSQFLRHLQSLAGTNVPEDFIKSIWTNRLPANIQTVMAAQTSVPLEALADIADRIKDITTPSAQVASTSASPQVLEVLAKELVELRKEVNALTIRHRQSRSRERGTRHIRSSSKRSDSNYRKFPICWYHYKFGSKAKTCMTPCDYKPENSTGRR